MPALLALRLKATDTLPRVEIPHNIRIRYPSVFNAITQNNNVRARVYVSRFFNEKGDIIKEYKRLYVLKLIKDHNDYYLDLADFHIKDGIPVGYYVELLLISFIAPLADKGTIEIPVFPNELIIERDVLLPDKIRGLIDSEKEALERVGRDIEIIGLLYSVGLVNIAADLIEALTRFYISDFEGSIKFFRKVIEGLRNYVREHEVPEMGKNRAELLKEFLSKTYHVLSNFGEHAGTYGFMYEATFSKDITVSVCRYFVSYIGMSSRYPIHVLYFY